MNNFADEEFIPCKQWIAEQIEAGFSWDDVAHLCVTAHEEKNEFDRLQNDELIIPQNMEFAEWREFTQFVKGHYSRITDLYGIADKNSNTLSVPTDTGSPWVRYKNYLLGKYTGKAKMSGDAVDMLENNCHWILNHLERDTRAIGSVKGLVMGSVQSGKTANMIGLVTMAAHYDWNIFIILSGTIDNLRKQTRDRFYRDLTTSGGVKWHVMDYASKPEYMTDIESGQRYLADDLDLNSFQNGRSSDKWMHRYVFVCLKNPRRLQNLIAWLHSKETMSARMRILIIDDEADQASINTLKMDPSAMSEEDIQRTAVNQLIIDLVKGCDAEGNASKAQFQAVNYISFTATPYANVLNEAYKDSLYPSNFICSLPESKEYFGAKAIWGSKTDEKYSGLNIIRTIGKDEMNHLKKLHKGATDSLPEEFQKSVAWYLCAAAILRDRGWKKPISMLIHTTSIQDGHYEEYEALKKWLTTKKREIVSLCKKEYGEEKNAFRLEDLKEGYPEYAKMDSVNDNFPKFADIKDEIECVLSEITNIELGDDKNLNYVESGLHLCVDNCRAKKMAEDGMYLRIVYPSDKQLANMKKAPVFIVMGGNTLARGLTLEGLVCTYFARNVNQADTLMQMARWFGYRHGYELLQRIWMPLQVQDKFQLIEEIDEKLKYEFEDFMKKGKSPAQFGPRIMSSSQIARFKLTSVNKSQNMEACDVDFSGDSYEITQFEPSEQILSENLSATEKFLSEIGSPRKSNAIEGAYSWDLVNSEDILNDFFGKYIISACSSLHVDIPIFIDWMKQMNQSGKYLKWDVAISGDNKSDARWKIAGADVGKIERSRKKKPEYIDIGSLRSGRDIVSDIDVDHLSDEDKRKFLNRKKSGKDLISLRYELGYGDIPILLLYRIDGSKGKESAYREKIGTKNDIIGFSIVIAGQEVSTDYVKTVHVRKAEF